MKNEKQPEGLPTEPTKLESNVVWSAMTEAPPRLNECWDWFGAVWAFDYGDPGPLSALVRSGQIPLEFNDVVADIVSGIRKPNKKAAAKAKIPPSERANLAATLSSMYGLIETIKWGTWELDRQHLKPGAITIADRLGVEPVDVLQELKADRDGVIADACRSFSVSQETLENLMREARQRIARWPSV